MIICQYPLLYNIGMNKLRSKAIAKAYVKAKFNGAAAGMEVFNTTKRTSAKSMMTKALKVPQVQNDIQEELSKAGMDKEFINKALHKGITHNLTYGKASQAVGADLLKQVMKVYNYLPKDSKTVVTEKRKVLLGKDYNTIKEELTQSVSTTQALLSDL